jgi:hypothetical protein
MSDLQSAGRILLFIGASIAIIGLLLILGGRFLPWLGRLPGDIHIQRGNFSCFFPLVTSIVLSLILTIVLNIIIRLMNK